LSDHYDPSAKVLRLSPDVYGGRSMSAVGVACHEAGHAMQDASRYPLLVMRNAAVPIANFGSSAAVYMLMFGAMLSFPPLIWIGIIGFAGTVLFQLVNLPVEFDASNRARAELVAQGIINAQEEPYVAKVLNAAALTYVAATLQSIMTLLYFLLRFAGNNRE
jgi:Zn-dependent membrane protease YugP